MYAQADLTVHSRDIAHEAVVAEVMVALASFLSESDVPSEAGS
jgi:hypothetical protein